MKGLALEELEHETSPRQLQAFFMTALEWFLSCGNRKTVVACHPLFAPYEGPSWAILHFVVQGHQHGCLEVDGEQRPYDLKAGDFLLWAAGARMTSATIPQDYVRVAIKIWPGQLHFDVNHVLSNGQELIDRHITGLDVPAPVWGPTRELISAVVHLAHDIPDTGIEQGVINAFMALLHRQLTSFDLSQQDSSNKTWARIRRYVDTHLGEPINRQDLADAIGVHPQHVSRLFRRHSNQGFRDYITAQRMARAIALLQEPNARVKDVCFACGYSSMATFSRVFTQTYGVVPSKVTSG